MAHRSNPLDMITKLLKAHPWTSLKVDLSAIIAKLRPVEVAAKVFYSEYLCYIVLYTLLQLIVTSEVGLSNFPCFTYTLYLVILIGDTDLLHFYIACTAGRLVLTRLYQLLYCTSCFLGFLNIRFGHVKKLAQVQDNTIFLY